MIRLESFNAPRVLAGAHLRLFYALTAEELAALDAAGHGDFVRETCQGRLDWCGDRLYTDFPGAPFVEKRSSIGGGIALDPTDADTARLIDRRVAEALDLPARCAVLCAVVRSARMVWILAWIGTGADLLRTSFIGYRAELANLPANDANLPEARARLLRALYPPEQK